MVPKAGKRWARLAQARAASRPGLCATAPGRPRGEALFRCARPSGVPRGPAASTGSLTSHRHSEKLLEALPPSLNPPCLLAGWKAISAALSGGSGVWWLHAAARMAAGLGAEAGGRRERPRQTRGGTSRLGRRGREGARRDRREGARRAPRQLERLRGCLQPGSRALAPSSDSGFHSSPHPLTRPPPGAGVSRPPLSPERSHRFGAHASQSPCQASEPASLLSSTHTKLKKKKKSLKNILSAN